MEHLNTAALVTKIEKLKEKRNAIILAHNYQLGEIQDVADFVGDSLELAKKATQTTADIIVFCGVHFMAETAKILNPEKTVLLPDLRAGCPMADMINAQELEEEKLLFQDETTVVCYVNSTAEVKAGSDVCCTSANSVQIINDFVSSPNIYFIPDQYLAQYSARFSDKNITYWPGYCPTHARITKNQIEQRRREYPDAEALVHPECTPEVIDTADQIYSTSGIIRHAKESKNQKFIIGTELGIIHRLTKENPEKQFIPVSEQAVCPNMKLIRLTTLFRALEQMIHQIEVKPEIIRKAKAAVDKMIQT